jgi:hypothetical protein
MPPGEKGDPDAFEHNGFLIATIVSPKDCSRCHEREYREFESSHHADAAKILGSLDNVLATGSADNPVVKNARRCGIARWQVYNYDQRLTG